MQSWLLNQDLSHCHICYRNVLVSIVTLFSNVLRLFFVFLNNASYRQTIRLKIIKIIKNIFYLTYRHVALQNILLFKIHKNDMCIQ